MKAGLPHDDPAFPDENNDPVWRLLAQAPRPEPDGWFAVRTLARCRCAEPLTNATRGLGRLWRWALGTGVGVGLAVLLVSTQLSVNSAADTDQKKVQEAFEIVAAMEPDSDSAPPSPWQDSSP